MAHSFKRKIKTLKSILEKYRKYIPKCENIECFVDGENIIIKLKKKNAEYHNVTIKAPTTDIDVLISRYRAILYQKENV